MHLVNDQGPISQEKRAICQLPHQQAVREEADPCPLGEGLLEADREAHLLPQPNVKRGGDALRQAVGRKAARLRANDDERVTVRGVGEARLEEEVRELRVGLPDPVVPRRTST